MSGCRADHPLFTKPSGTGRFLSGPFSQKNEGASSDLYQMSSRLALLQKWVQSLGDNDYWTSNENLLQVSRRFPRSSFLELAELDPMAVFRFTGPHKTVYLCCFGNVIPANACPVFIKPMCPLCRAAYTRARETLPVTYMLLAGILPRDLAQFVITKIMVGPL
jgi:hypothetical protein